MDKLLEWQHIKEHTMRRFGKQTPRTKVEPSEEEIPRTSVFKLRSSKKARIFAQWFESAKHIKGSARVKVKGLREDRSSIASVCYGLKGRQCGGASI